MVATPARAGSPSSHRPHSCSPSTNDVVNVDPGGGARLDEPHVGVVQRVVDAAAHPQRRELRRVGPADQPPQVMGRVTDRLVAEHPREQLGILRPGREGAKALQVQRTRQAGRRGEPLRLAQRPLHRAVPTHRQARDERVITAAGHVEEGAHQLRQLLGQERPVAAASGLVGVEAAMDLGHDHGQSQRRHIPLDRRATQPDGVVVAQAVEQIEHRRRPVELASGHADLRRRLLRQEHGHRRAEAERLGEEVAPQVSHRYPLPRSMSSRHAASISSRSSPGSATATGSTNSPMSSRPA